MRAHILITDNKTFPVVRDNGFWGVGVKGIPSRYEDVIKENLKNGKKPYFGMIADILGTRVGDIVFFYERQVGFHGIYRIVSKPFFDTTPIGCVGSTWPLRLKVECINYFPLPVPEDLLFSSKEYESRCWAWFYRKIQGARGINTINPETAEVLVELLVKLNGNAIKKLESMRNYPNKLTKEVTLPIGELSKNGRVLLEDILRGWLIANIDNSNHNSIREMLGPVEDIEWFANNVPYHVSGKSIDILIYHKNAKYTGYPLRYRYSVIELKREEAKSKDVSQLIEYSKWVAGRLAGGEVEMVQPILIASDFAPEAEVKATNSDFSNRGILLYKYRVVGNDIKFTRVEI